MSSAEIPADEDADQLLLWGDAPAEPTQRANGDRLWSIKDVGRYLDVMRNELRAERLGVEFTFHSAHRPIEHYSRAFEAAGLVIEALREPGLSDEIVAQDPRLARHRLLPNFLYFCVRHAPR